LEARGEIIPTENPESGTWHCVSKRCRPLHLILPTLRQQ
jgi:hypothetical protein